MKAHLIGSGILLLIFPIQLPPQISPYLRDQEDVTATDKERIYPRGTNQLETVLQMSNNN